MQEYCENVLSCRRQTFSDKFTETRVRLGRCGVMCDNCKHQAGGMRRSYIVHQQPLSAPQTKVNNKRRYGALEYDNTEVVDEDGWMSNRRQAQQESASSSTDRDRTKSKVPKASFIKASKWTAGASAASVHAEMNEDDWIEREPNVLRQSSMPTAQSTLSNSSTGSSSLRPTGFMKASSWPKSEEAIYNDNNFAIPRKASTAMSATEAVTSSEMNTAKRIAPFKIPVKQTQKTEMIDLS